MHILKKKAAVEMSILRCLYLKLFSGIILVCLYGYIYALKSLSEVSLGPNLEATTCLKIKEFLERYFSAVRHLVSSKIPIKVKSDITLMFTRKYHKLIQMQISK